MATSIRALLTGACLSFVALGAAAAPKTVFEHGTYRPYTRSVTITELNSAGPNAAAQEGANTDETSSVASKDTDKVFIGTRIIKDGNHCRRIVTKLKAMDAINAEPDLGDMPATDTATETQAIEAPTVLTTDSPVKCPR